MKVKQRKLILRIAWVLFSVVLILSVALATQLNNWSQRYRDEADAFDLSALTIPAKPIEFTDRQVEELLAKRDPKFYNHKGTDFGAIVKTFVVNYREKEPRFVPGSQTISYDLALRLLYTEDSTPDAALHNMIVAFFLAHRIEGVFTKDEILKLYFHHSDPSIIAIYLSSENAEPAGP